MTHLQALRSKLRKFHPKSKEAKVAKEEVIADIDRQELEEEESKK
jgi:hypothetical protein